MTDIRRTILWVIFGFSMVLLWDQWQVHNGRQATFFPKPPAAGAQAAATPASGAATVPVSSLPASTANPGQVPSAAAPSVAREKFEVRTDVFRLKFDSEGGSLVFAEFLKHADMVDPARKFVLFDESAERVYQAQTGLIGGPFATHKTPMRFVGDRELKDGQNTLVVRFESEETGGLQLVKSYTLQRGSHVIKVSHEVLNTGSVPASPQLYMQLVRDGNKPAGESSFYFTFTGPAIYTEAKKYTKVEFSDIEKNKADIDKTSTNGYVAMVQHYFASAWLLPDGVTRENFVRKVDNNLFAVGMITPLGEIAPGQRKVLENTLFAGPQEERCLNRWPRASTWSRTMAGWRCWPSPCTGCSTSCTACWATGAGRLSDWCC
jgi:YidC/Oxa1 family membrane protein insertase